ncbi:siphovirus ReqiPepy6 Gp37-like family protein [Kribbella sp. NBC_01505]|uniref:siphovirus ReqiPepy6 Gp37-like family protein n=1 Tax=Kribbella sp. NBC_01505 TaxID=2903580 RepID=UPI00386E474A
MLLDDITVLVRDKNYVIQGMIASPDLDIEANVAHNNVGSWKVWLAADHPMATLLRTPGAGLVVQGPSDVIFSGPTVKPELAITPEDPGGTITIEGVTDEVVLADALAFPDPAHSVNAGQAFANDYRTGKRETLMHAYVNANIGPAAIVSRRKAGLTMGPNLARGATVTKGPRFQGLGELLAELAIEPGQRLGFKVVQRGAGIRFETYQVTDKTKLIRLDARNRTLSGQRVAISPPGLTAAIVAGQGEGVKRQLREYTNATATAAEAEWGRRIERFIDQRNTDDWTELDQAGNEPLDDEGFTSLAVQAVPAEDSFMTFGADWYLGDKISVVVENQELVADVTGFVLKANKEGFKVGVVIGDPQGFSTAAALNARVGNTENRISSIERNMEKPQKAPYTYRSGVQLAASNTNLIPTANSWQPVRFTTDRGHSTDASGQTLIPHTSGVGDGRFYLNRPGRYQVAVSFPFNLGNTTGKRWMRVSSSIKGELLFDSVNPGSSHSALHVTGSLVSEPGESIWVDLLQTSGAALGPAGTTQALNGSISIDYLGPA